jgi:hypothetical protein
MSVDPRHLFDWYPIEYLESVEQALDEHYGLSDAATYVLPRTKWAAKVRTRATMFDADPEVPGWTTPHRVDIDYVTEEMRRRNGGDYLFRWTAAESESDLCERLRREINATAESMAERTN